MRRAKLLQQQKEFKSDKDLGFDIDETITDIDQMFVEVNSGLSNKELRGLQARIEARKHKRKQRKNGGIADEIDKALLEELTVIKQISDEKNKIVNEIAQI